MDNRPIDNQEKTPALQDISALEGQCTAEFSSNPDVDNQGCPYVHLSIRQ